MCAVSYIATDWNKRVGEPWVNDYDGSFIPNQPSFPSNLDLQRQISVLHNEMQELKKLLLAAKEYDKNTGQPDCEMQDKVELIKRLAKLVGVDMNEVF